MKLSSLCLPSYNDIDDTLICCMYEICMQLPLAGALCLGCTLILVLPFRECGLQILHSRICIIGYLQIKASDSCQGLCKLIQTF